MTLKKGLKTAWG